MDLISFILINSAASSQTGASTNTNGWEKYGYTKSLIDYISDDFNSNPIPYIIAISIVIVWVIGEIVYHNATKKVV